MRVVYVGVYSPTMASIREDRGQVPLPKIWSAAEADIDVLQTFCLFVVHVCVWHYDVIASLPRCEFYTIKWDRVEEEEEEEEDLA